MWAFFNRFLIEMTKKQALSASHQGDCELDVVALLKDTKIRQQLEKITDRSLKEELKDYGAWDEGELMSREDNEKRIIWIAACNIREDIKEVC